MPDGALPGPDAGRAGTQAILRLLAGDGAGDIAMLVADAAPRHVGVEDAFPARARIGTRIRVPEALLSAEATLIVAADQRLPVGWIETCGRRPTHLASAPIAGGGLHILVATCGPRAPDLARLCAAAETIALLIECGETTQRSRDTHRRIGALVHNLPVPLVFVDARDLHVFLNDQARALLELQSPMLQERAVATALGRLMSDEAKERKAALATDPTASMSFEIRHRARAYQVDTRWIDEPELAGRVWLFSEITREKAFRQRLSEAARLLQLMAENVSEGVALADEALCLTVWNHEFARLLDYPPEKMREGADLLDLIHVTAERGELGAAPPDVIVDAFVDASRRVDGLRLEVQRTDGRILDLRGRLLGEGHFVLTARDVTDERQAARLKDELVSTVSHELRTPLTAIAGSLKLLASGTAGELPTHARELLTIADRNGERLRRLIDDLLDIDKLQRERMDLAPVPTDLAALAAEAIAQNAPYAGTFGISLVLEAPHAPPIARIDPFRMLQVLGNLLSNAAKFSPAGSIVRVVLTVRGTWADIGIIDSGRGISPAFVKRLFTPFAQEDRALDGRPAGTGLGLAISRRIVELHGGEIAVEPGVTVGTTVRVRLPLLPDEAV